MELRQSQLLAALSGLLALLVLGIVWLEPAPAPDQDEGRRWSRVFKESQAVASTVTGLSLTLDGDTIELERRDEEAPWRLTAPVEVDAEQARVAHVVDGVLALQVSPPLDLDPAEVGLSPPAARIVLHRAQGSTTRVELGDNAAVGSASYIRIDDGPVVASRTQLRAALPQSLTELRSPDIATFARSTVSSLMVERPDAEPLRLRKTGRDWWLQLDPPLRADGPRVDRLIDALRFVQIDSFAAPPTDAPAWAVHMELTGADAISLRFQGRPGDDAWQAEGPVQPGPVTIQGRELSSALVGAPETWADPRVMSVSLATLSRLELSAEGATPLDSERTADGWSDTRTEAVLVALETGTARRVGDIPQPSGAATGTLRAHHGDEVVEITLYQATSSEGVVATETGTDRPFIITAGTMKALSDALSG